MGPMQEQGREGARTIVLRLWYETSPEETEEEWRGEARDVVTGRVLYFRHLDALADVITRLLADDG